MGVQEETRNGRLEKGRGGGRTRDKTGEMNLQPEELPRLSDKNKNELQDKKAGLVRHGHLETSYLGDVILPSSECLLIAFCSLFVITFSLIPSIFTLYLSRKLYFTEKYYPEKTNSQTNQINCTLFPHANSVTLSQNYVTCVKCKMALQCTCLASA